jgi:type I restriction enzyme S subunit
MISELKPYSVYKDSGQKWLGDIPRSWKVRRAKFLFREVDERSTTGKEELLSVSHLTGVTPRSQKKITMFLAKSNVGHKVCRPGDLVINTMWAWMGALGLSNDTGIVSPAYGVYRSLLADDFDPRFADLLLRTPLFVAEYQRRSTGVNSSRLRLYPEQFLGMSVIVPPPHDQVCIVRFLDWANRRLERTIRAKRKVVALLTEQKQSIIHRAVTRGLNPDVCTRPSGVPWLGDIPTHWKVIRTKFIAHIKTGGRDTADRIDDGPFPFFVRSQTVENIDTFSFDGEAVLTAGDGAGVAKVFHYINGKFDYHQRVYKFSGFRQLRGQFFFLYLRSTLRFEALDASAKSTVDSLRLPVLQNFPTVLPPIEEQLEILSAVESETRSLDIVIDRVRREINLLREYRARLIEDVVKGKLDVREASTLLPEDPVGTDESNGEVDELDEDGEDFAEEGLAN